MVGTYKLGDREVSEREFKEKVYGKDSKAAESAKKKESKKSKDLAKAGSKGSSYSVVTRKDGSKEVYDKTSGKKVKTEKYKEAKRKEDKAKKESKKNSIVVDEKGRQLKPEDYLVEEQKAFSDSQRARLTVGEGGKVSQTKNVEFREQIREKDFPRAKGETEEEYRERLKDITEYFSKKRIKQISKSEAGKGRESITLGVGVDFETKKEPEGEPAKPINPVDLNIGRNKELKSDRTIPMLNPGERRRGLSGAMDWIQEKRRNALEKQKMNEVRGKSTYENIPILTGLGIAQGAVGLAQLGGSAIKTLRFKPDENTLSETRESMFDAAETTKDVSKEVRKDPSLLYKVPKEKVEQIFTNIGKSAAEDPLGFAGQLAVGYGVTKGISAGVKAGVKTYNAPKITGGSQGSTVRVDLADDVSRSATTTKTNIRAGSKKYVVEGITKTVDRADDANVRLQSSSTNLKVRNVNKKGAVVNTNTGFARSEAAVVKTKEGVVIGRADTVQATNVGSKSVIRQGDVVSVGRSDPSGYTMSNIVKTGKSAKFKVVGSADDLAFKTDKTKKISSIEGSASRKVAEFEAPVKTTYQTDFGKVTVPSKDKVVQTVYDDFGSARAGRFLSKSDKATNIKVDPYSQTASSGNVNVVYKADDVVGSLVKKANPSKDVISKSSSSGGLAQSSQSVVKVKTPAPQSSSSQALTAVRDVVDEKVKTISVGIDKLAKPSSDVAVSSAVVSSSKQDEAVKMTEIKQDTVQSIKPAQKQQEKPIISTKSFTSTNVLSEQKVDLSGASVTKSSSRSKRKSISKTFTDSIVQQKPKQETKIMPKIMQQPMINTPKPSSAISRPLMPPFPTPVPTPKPSQRSMSGFGVFVRQKGVFKQVGSKAYNFMDAKNVGAYTVSNTPRATFFVKPISSRVSAAPEAARGFFGRVRSTLVKKRGMFIEKKEKRITTKGELAGITMKGILANKNKNTKRGFKL